MDDPISQFSYEVFQDVLDISPEESGKDEMSLTSTLLNYLIEAQEIEDPIQIDFKERGYKLDAYSVNLDEIRADVFVTVLNDYNQTVLRRRIDSAVSACVNIINKVTENNIPDQIRNPDMNDFISKFRTMIDLNSGKKFTTVRLFVLTNGKSNIENYESDSDDQNYNLDINIWDLERFYRRRLENFTPEPVEINFESLGSGFLPCIFSSSESNIITLLTIIPGEFITQIYEEFGQRLLEGNVRAYLQNRGNVNKGIINTINDNPERFLTYNNGISVVATDADYLEEGGVFKLKSLSGFQIVNGAQTTASIHRAKIMDKLQVDKIKLQAKRK